MGFLMDLLFGKDSEDKSKTKPKSFLFSSDDDYYEELHGDAMAGDSGAADEMEDEFGDDWEGEY